MKTMICMPFALALLAACGGATTGGAPTVEEEMRFDDLQVERDRVAAAYLAQSAVGAFPLPVAGTASYTGLATLVMGLGDFDEDQVRSLSAGTFTASVDFATATVDGTATDFLSVANPQEVFDDDSATPVLGAALAGSFTFTGPVAPSAGPATLRGTITDPGFAQLGVDVPILDQEILGTDQDVLRLDGEQNITYSNGAPGWFVIDAIGTKD